MSNDFEEVPRMLCRCLRSLREKSNVMQKLPYLVLVTVLVQEPSQAWNRRTPEGCNFIVNYAVE